MEENTDFVSFIMSLLYKGETSTGKKYKNLGQLWTEELGEVAAQIFQDTVAVRDGQSETVELKDKQHNSCQDGDVQRYEAQRNEWYQRGVRYWEKTDATVDGVLGGFGYISQEDLKGSRQFLEQINVNTCRAIDCGAGIGRCAKDLFLPMFDKVYTVPYC